MRLRLAAASDALLAPRRVTATAAHAIAPLTATAASDAVRRSQRLATAASDAAAVRTTCKRFHDELLTLQTKGKRRPFRVLGESGKIPAISYGPQQNGPTPKSAYQRPRRGGEDAIHGVRWKLESFLQQPVSAHNGLLSARG